jgi:hypothetical protein
LPAGARVFPVLPMFKEVLLKRRGVTPQMDCRRCAPGFLARSFAQAVFVTLTAAGLEAFPPGDVFCCSRFGTFWSGAGIAGGAGTGA